MDQLKKFFPHAFKALDVKALIIAIIIYIVIGFNSPPIRFCVNLVFVHCSVILL